MDFRFDFVAIFLILDVVSVRCQNESFKNNPFLRPHIFPVAENNVFLSNPFLPNKVALQQEIPFNVETNPFFPSRTQTRIESTATQKPPPSLVPPFKQSNTPTISERKCDEYMREIWDTNLASSQPAISHGPIKLSNGCGNANHLIVGGTEAEIGEFPHMVALGVTDPDFRVTCGGTLISHTWVLSAAHCTFGNNIPTHAKIGFHRLSDQTTGITITIKDIKVHEDYESPAMYADIALVQLMNAVTFSTAIQPACLYQQFDFVPRKVWATGWGIMEFAGDPSDALQKVQLDVINQIHCTERHNTSVNVPDGIRPSMICAGDSRNWTRDTCQGDSGGPLQIYRDNKCLFQVIGITSFGEGCASGLDTPAIYTRVPYYVPWIEDNVWPEG